MLQKIKELREELAKGQEQIMLLDRRRQDLRDTMLRISGAIQVLEEFLKEEHARKREVEHSVNGAVPLTASIG